MCDGSTSTSSLVNSSSGTARVTARVTWSTSNGDSVLASASAWTRRGLGYTGSQSRQFLSFDYLRSCVSE